MRKLWTINETYAVPSSVRNQDLSTKITEPQINFGKATRERTKSLGIFPTHKNKGHYKIKSEL